MHPLRRRYLAEDLVRLRAPDEHRRYVASQRAGRVDPNPHQIDAVIFALQRIPEGGCILADEVGLGKTIEAGLVIAQLLAEGATRILLITPKALLGQWRQELFELFAVTAQEWAPGVDLAAPGVFLVTRDFAGGRGADTLMSAPPFDLAVIDEAHEVFAGIYKRFDVLGNYLADSPHAQMAGRVWRALRATPVLLLTATPIQNSLTELWGLAQFVEPTGTLLGDLPTFRQVFCPGDDRRLADGQDHELRTRLAEICQRTLRRQAQEFMKQPFVTRRAQLFEYTMSPPEKALYDEVTAYLLQPRICAFRGNQRRLLLISFHRQMASSIRALAKSLGRVAARLERQLSGLAPAPDAIDEDLAALAEDLEDDEGGLEPDTDDGPEPTPEKVAAELERVRGFIARATTLTSDSKAQALVRAVRLVLERGAQGQGSGKLVIFTESLTTQAYLRELLLEQRLLRDEDVTLFRGTNEGPRVHQAVERWREEQLVHLPEGARPTKEIITRLALVHEFRTRSKVFISTEAGAKGLNLQFADTLVNYDLPWNPQRIEQRIGRIHRYGQKREATVINFIATDNEAQRLTFEILSQKLELFGTVLDASDAILHEAKGDSPETLAGALAADLEASLRKIYERARTQEDIQEELKALRASLDERRARFEDIHRRTSGLIESRFDEQVRRAFKRIQDELPGRLAELDRDLERLVAGYLDALGVPHARLEEEGRVLLKVEAHPALPDELRDGVLAALGDAGASRDVEPLHLGHPLVRAAVDDARAATRARLSARVVLAPGAPAALSARRGERCRLRVVKVRHEGFEPTEELLALAVFARDEAVFLPEEARWLVESELASPLAEAAGALGSSSGSPRGSSSGSSSEPALAPALEEALEDALEEALFVTQAQVSRRAQERYQRTVEQIETAVEDRLLVLGRRRSELLARVASAEQARDGAIGAEARTRAEQALRRATEKLEAVELEVGRLRERDDVDYTRWMDRANARRSRPPAIEVVLDAELELA